jgi:hypothetical protein
MKRTNMFMLCIILMLFASNLYAQQGPAASGGDATGLGGSVAYTVGQVDYIFTSGSNGNINQGLQQPYTIGITTGLHETGINLSCAISPNPTTDFVVLSVEKGDLQNMSYSLFDVKGQMIRNGRISSTSTTIAMADFADALYLLKVYTNNNEVKSFKLIKNK